MLSLLFYTATRTSLADALSILAFLDSVTFISLHTGGAFGVQGKQQHCCRSFPICQNNEGWEGYNEI